jgi:hypothetical protein
MKEVGCYEFQAAGNPRLPECSGFGFIGFAFVEPLRNNAGIDNVGFSRAFWPL